MHQKMHQKMHHLCFGKMNKTILIMEPQRFKIIPPNQQDSDLLVTDTKYNINFWVPKMSHGKPSAYHLKNLHLTWDVIDIV